MTPPSVSSSILSETTGEGTFKPKFSLPQDIQAIFWLAGLPLLVAAWWPWVLLRPNRLAEGELLRLPPTQAVLATVLALALPLAARWQPRWLGVLAAAVVGVGLWQLGHLTGMAVAGQAEAARASASSGFWLWSLGAVLAVYGNQLLAPHAEQGGRGQTVALGWSRWLWLLPIVAVAGSGQLAAWSVVQEWQAQHERFGTELLTHLKLVMLALSAALVLGAPLAVWAARKPNRAAALLGLTSGIQTLPSLALLGLLIAPLAWLADHVPLLRAWGVSGIGVAPALVAMTLYALLPLVRGGILALRNLNAGVLDAARGMGMTPWQVFWQVELPLSLPMWLSGLRQAAVMLVGVASVAQLIGAGGLGYFILGGLQAGAADLILLGALPAAGLALLLDGGLRLAERLLQRRIGETP